MPFRLEITLKPELFDAEGAIIRKKASDYFGISLEQVRTVHIVTLDMDLQKTQLDIIKDEVFTNPVSQISSFKPLPIEFDWGIWVGFRPGVRDNAGATAKEAVEDILKRPMKPHEAIYTSKRYCVQGNLLPGRDVERIASELLANDIIQQWKLFDKASWDPDVGIGFILPKVVLEHQPTVSIISAHSEDSLKKVSMERNLALNPADIPTIRAYFLDETVLAERRRVSLSDPTDVELEYISQARSDHCNHNTFKGKFYYLDMDSGETEEVDDLFETFIETPTLEIMKKKPWVVSVLWDNAGVGRFDETHLYTITGETHNSPSNMEAYGGAITGIVGVYRDPMGTGKGSKLVMGSYGFCIGPRDYSGWLKPRLHPRRLLDGVIEGVRDGGNKSGIPTPFGQVFFHPGYMGKCLVFVTAVGIMPALINGKPAEKKTTRAGDLVIMCGGRVGKDGIHGVTAASETFSEHTPAGHVQIGDPYTQKKMHDFLIEARDQGLIQFITDNGGGGLSSSIGETARFSNGCEVQLEKVPLKYEGLDQWEIWISESQERMTVAVRPEHLDRFMALSDLHEVESTVIGSYTDAGKLHITYNDKTCAYVNMDLLKSGFPQWKFEAQWQSPKLRGLFEPVISPPKVFETLILDILSRPNICSKEWIARQYDHEVQGTSVIKPLVGKHRDVAGDAVVIRPVLDSNGGLVFSQALLPCYSAIDAYHMTLCTIDEAVRRVISVGADPDHIGGVDNFCWPDIAFDPRKNPDGKFKAAQLVRACKAMAHACRVYGIPLLSGKDSMYVDGHLLGRYGETHKVSALETLQFSAISAIKDVATCVTMDAKASGDGVFLLGMTRDELGGSQYYEHLGYLGVNVPKVVPTAFSILYRALHRAIQNGLVASVHGVYSGGLGVHAVLTALGGDLGITIDLSKVPVETPLRPDTLLYSESAGRFIVTVPSNSKETFRKLFKGLPCAEIGRITDDRVFAIKETSKTTLVRIPLDSLKTAWKSPFGSL